MKLSAQMHQTGLSFMIQEEHGIKCMPCSSRIINEMLPEIQSLIHSLLYVNGYMVARCHETFSTDASNRSF